MTKSTILTNEPIWIDASRLCEYAYALIEELSDEERYGMQSDLREHSFNLTTDIAEGLASYDPHEAKHSYEHAMRDCYGLKNVLTMAKRVGYVKLDPDMMMTLDHLAGDILTAITHASEQEAEVRKQYEKELAR